MLKQKAGLKLDIRLDCDKMKCYTTYPVIYLNRESLAVAVRT